MRTAITLARKHGEKKFAMISGQEVPIQIQRENFKKIQSSNEHPELAELELWESDTGCVKYHRAYSPDELKAKAKEFKDREVAQAKEQEKIAKAREADEKKKTDAEKAAREKEIEAINKQHKEVQARRAAA